MKATSNKCERRFPFLRVNERARKPHKQRSYRFSQLS
jgi:hypothetical protein